MATRITQQDLLVGGEASSVAFTPDGESIALTCTVTELVADSVVQMIVIDDQGLVKASARVFGTGAKKIVVGKLDGTITVTVMKLQGSGQVTVADPAGGAVETTDIADLAVTTAKLALLAVDTGQLAALAVSAAKLALDAKTVQNVIADPGGAGEAIPVTASGSVAITTAGAETNTLAIPSFAGQQLSLNCDVYAVGDRVITASAGINVAGNTIMTFGAAEDHIVLTAVQLAGGLVWRVTHNEGVALT